MRIHSYGFWIFNDREGIYANLGLFSMVFEKRHKLLKLSMSVRDRFNIEAFLRISAFLYDFKEVTSWKRKSLKEIKGGLEC